MEILLVGKEEVDNSMSTKLNCRTASLPGRTKEIAKKKLPRVKKKIQKLPLHKLLELDYGIIDGHY